MSIGQGRLECAHEHAKNIRFGDHADDGADLNHRQTAYTITLNLRKIIVCQG